MIKKIILGVSVVSIALIVTVLLIIRNDNVQTLSNGEVYTLNYTFDETHDFGYDALYDPWVNEYEPLVKETIKLKGNDVETSTIFVNLESAVANDMDAKRLLNITLTCNGDLLDETCTLNKTIELGIEIRLCEAQMEDYYDALHASGLAFSFTLEGIDVGQVITHLYDTYQAEDVERVYVEYGKNPSHDMVVNFHADYALKGTLKYRLLGTEQWQSKIASSESFPFREERVYRTYLNDLDADATYELKFSETGRVYQFKTMPETLNRPINIVFTGDSRSLQPWFYDLNNIIGDLEPDLVVGTGDYVADEGELAKSHSDLWVHFIDSIHEPWTNEDNHLVPFMPAWGNHEASSGWSGSQVSHKAYLPLLYAFPNNDDAPYELEGYGYRQFGDYFTLIFLDSFHTNEIDVQTKWLTEMHDVFSESKHIIPVYHSAVYPSQKAFDIAHKREIRTDWGPLFESMGVRVVMESCDHTYKKSVPIGYDAENPHGFQTEDGMVFVGDGGWGAPLRNVLVENGGNFDPTYSNEDYWWIADAAGLDYNIDNSKHFHEVVLHENSLTVNSYNHLNELFDSFEMWIND